MLLTVQQPAATIIRQAALQHFKADQSTTRHGHASLQPPHQHSVDSLFETLLLSRLLCIIGWPQLK
jgi:hypothetical protein